MVEPCKFRALRGAGALALTLMFAGPALAATPQSKGCTPSFPFQGGWLGADAAYSIPISQKRVVWIFGDTLYGRERAVTGNNPRMVRNSIGISTCDAARGWHIEYVIRRNAAGELRDFFEARDKGIWYWALDGFFYQDTLWVTLLRVRDKAVTGSAALAFETCGTDLARVSDLTAPPQQWKVEIFPLVPDGVKAYPSATAVVQGDYAYVFANYENPPRPMLLTRLPLKGLAAPQENLQYLAKDGSWKPGFNPVDAKPVMTPGASEMSVRHHPELKKWVAVMIGPTFPSDEIRFRTAPELAGPWSEGQTVYRIPDVQPGAPHYDRDTFCYAAKEHPEFEAPGKLLFTYVCNTFTPRKLATNPTIYFPKTVVVPMPRGNSPRPQ